MAIRGIEGQFGSGKSSLATFIANKYQGPNVHIWSNIPMNEYKIKNYHYFRDDEFLTTLRTINLINDSERKKAGYNTPNSSLTRRHRELFSLHYVFFDEIGAIMNNRNWKNQDVVQSEYLNQNRKNFLEIFCITADGTQTDKSLRRFCESWYYCSPLSTWFPILSDFKVVREQIKDIDGNVKLESYLSKDERGDDVVKQRPMDYYLTFFYQPKVWSLYDDLHKNISDPNKFEVNFNILQNIIELNPYLGDLIKNTYPTIFDDKKLYLAS